MAMMVVMMDYGCDDDGGVGDCDGDGGYGHRFGGCANAPPKEE